MLMPLVAYLNYACGRLSNAPRCPRTVLKDLRLYRCRFPTNAFSLVMISIALSTRGGSTNTSPMPFQARHIAPCAHDGRVQRSSSEVALVHASGIITILFPNRGGIFDSLGHPIALPRPNWPRICAWFHISLAPISIRFFPYASFGRLKAACAAGNHPNNDPFRITSRILLFACG